MGVVSALLFRHPLGRELFFGLAVAATFFVALRRLEYGVLILLAELLIGSKGHLFWLTLGSGTVVSVRMGLFVAVLLAWISTCIRRRCWPGLVRSRAGWFVLPLFALLAWGILNGLFVQQYPVARVLEDANNWLFFAMVFPLYDVAAGNRACGTHVHAMFRAGIAFLIAKATFFFVVFAAAIPQLTQFLYHFERQTGGGQMASGSDGMWRIYFWSELFLIPALVCSLAVLFRAFQERRARMRDGAAVIAVVYALVLTLFRSFWLGVIVAVAAWVFLVWMHRTHAHPVGRPLGKTVGVLILAVVVSAFAIQAIGTGLALWAGGRRAIEKELFTTQEPGIRNRLNQAGPLWKQIKEAPIAGSGFGTTVTYQSIDARNYGAYTTTAFELGWLDMAMETGMLGVVAYVVLLGYLCRRWWIQMRQAVLHPAWGSAMIAMVVGLMAVHLVSPFLNHPIGIGCVVVLFVWAAASLDKIAPRA